MNWSGHFAILELEKDCQKTERSSLYLFPVPYSLAPPINLIRYGKSKMQNTSRKSWRSLFVQPSAIGSLVFLSLLSFLVLWIPNFSSKERGYQVTIIFSNAGGITPGTKVFYRGVEVGRVLRVNLQPEGVAVEVKILSAEQLIPTHSSFEAVQSSMKGEIAVKITPLATLPSQKAIARPLDPNCNPQIIICNGSRLQGQEPMDMAEIISSFESVSDFFDDPEAISNVKAIAQKTATSLAEFTAALKKINQSDFLNNLER